MRETPLEDNKKRELSTALHVYFKDWLYGNDPYYIIVSSGMLENHIYLEHLGLYFK